MSREGDRELREWARMTAKIGEWRRFASHGQNPPREAPNHSRGGLRKEWAFGRGFGMARRSDAIHLGAPYPTQS